MKTITIEKIIKAPIERIFEAFITPSDLMQWYSATEGWTTPHAIIDAQPGGSFSIGFRDPEGLHTFDFNGVYTEVLPPSRIAYTIADGRKVTVDFSAFNDATKIVQEFEMENQNPEEKQREGWSAQLDHLEKYLSSKV